MDMNEQIQLLFNEMKSSIHRSKNPAHLIDQVCQQVIVLVNQRNSFFTEDLLQQMESFEMDENLLDKE